MKPSVRDLEATILELRELLEAERRECSEDHITDTDAIFRAQEEIHILFKEMNELVHRWKYRREKISAEELMATIIYWTENEIRDFP